MNPLCYHLLLTLLAVQRLSEILISKRNFARLVSQGGQLQYSQQFKWMVLMHVSWFISCFVCGFFSSAFQPFWISTLGVVVLLGCQWVRFLSMRALKSRWSTQILTVPGNSVIRTGIYSYLRHPNYLIVVIEILIVPLLASAWAVATVFSVLNCAILLIRIRSEESALILSSDYADYTKSVPRFIPKLCLSPKL